MDKKPVKTRAVLARINRRLAAEGRELKKCRHDNPALPELGDWYMVDGNGVVAKQVDLPTLAAELGCLKDYEQIEN